LGFSVETTRQLRPVWGATKWFSGGKKSDRENILRFKIINGGNKNMLRGGGGVDCPEVFEKLLTTHPRDRGGGGQFGGGAVQLDCMSIATAEPPSSLVERLWTGPILSEGRWGGQGVGTQDYSQYVHGMLLGGTGGGLWGRDIRRYLAMAEQREDRPAIRGGEKKRQ